MILALVFVTYQNLSSDMHLISELHLFFHFIFWVPFWQAAG